MRAAGSDKVLLKVQKTELIVKHMVSVDLNKFIRHRSGRDFMLTEVLSCFF